MNTYQRVSNRVTAIRWFFVCLLLACAIILVISPVSAIEIDSDSIWEILASSTQTNPVPDRVKEILGKRVQLTGWVIPNEFESGELTSFLLTRYPGGCIHIPLPLPSSVIHVKMSAKSKKLKSTSRTKKVTVQGVLTRSDWIDASYEIQADRIVEN